MNRAVVIVFFATLSLVACYAQKQQRCQGFCMEANDCPNKPEPEFCPNQNDICCYGIRLSETKCRNRGGECVSTCPDFLTDTRALDCPAGERCCIFVH